MGFFEVIGPEGIEALTSAGAVTLIIIAFIVLLLVFRAAIGPLFTLIKDMLDTQAKTAEAMDKLADNIKDNTEISKRALYYARQTDKRVLETVGRIDENVTEVLHIVRPKPVRPPEEYPAWLRDIV